MVSVQRKDLDSRQLEEKDNEEEKCHFCLESESMNHLLFRCPLAVYMWSVVRDVLGWNAIPKSVKNFVENLLFLRRDK
jgi:hypothetical protein